MDAITLRSLERILAVVIGGLSIVLGYRLFLALPQERDAAGTVRLPWNISVVFSRVGPGVFFALFGAAVVGFSLQAAVHVEQSGSSIPGSSRTAGGTGTASYSGFGPLITSKATDLATRRLAAQVELEYLNTLPGLLRSDLSEDQRRAAARVLAWTKLAIMEPLWDSDWGDLARFKDWAEVEMRGPVPSGLEAAAAFFTAGGENAK